MMDENRFWSIVDTSREQARKMEKRPGQDFLDLHEQTLADALRQLQPADIAGFNTRFWTYHGMAYRWDLWAIAYWMHGGCGDDGFIDFRSCLISLGKQRFLQALDDPDSLAEIIDRPDTPYMQAEGFQYVASKVYREKTGQEAPLDDIKSASDEPAGEQFDFDDEEEMRERFPRLLDKMPEMGD